MLPRVIARMDIKSKNLIKGVHLEGLRVLGEAKLFAKIYYEQGADEIIYLDSVASLYERSYLVDLIKETANDVFIPLTVGGGLKLQKMLNQYYVQERIKLLLIPRPSKIPLLSRK